MNYPKVSIITCVYNGEKYIHRLFESILSMGYPNIEHIIVDDGSTDNTFEVVKKYEQKYKNMHDANLYIKYIKQENMGLGGATNTGLKAVTGEYWTWINCDDWYEKNAFNIIMNHFKKKKIEMVLINRYKAFIDGNNIRKEVLMPKETEKRYKSTIKIRKAYYKSTRNFLHYVVKTTSLDRINPSRTIDPLRWTQDAQLYAILIGNLNVSYEQKPLVNYYVHEDSLYFTGMDNMDEPVLNSIIKTYCFLSINEKDKNAQIELIKLDYNYLHFGLFDTLFIKNRKKEFINNYRKIYKKKLPYAYKKYRRKELNIKYITAFIPFFWKMLLLFRKY